MKKALLFFIIFLVFMGTTIYSQQKYALVIGNGTYTGYPWGSLRNAVNDATDMKTALEGLGFQVEFITNGNLSRMETAVINLKQRLRASPNSYGFFYYAGHGAQNTRDGGNYLIPVDAETPSLNLLPQRALPVQFVMDELEEAKNELNMIVLDACREVPKALERNASRGLSVIGNVPKGSIVMYATAANKTAADGEGRNGLFTSYLLKNLTTPGLTVSEVFDRTGADVARATNGEQYPEKRQMYYETAYLGSRPSSAGTAGISSQQMVLINGGTFTMGSPRTEANRDRDEVQHQVTVSSFYMSAKEVTLKEYLDVMMYNPNGLVQGANLPVFNVNFYDAIEYCNARSIAEGLTPAYNINYTISDPNNRNDDDISRFMVTWDRNANGYRLPTEAEWEYACRAEQNSAYNFGMSMSNSLANFNGSIVFPVGSFSPNRWGLYDMHGNVAEWCWDWYGDYSASAQTDPSGPASGQWRVARGGSWENTKSYHLRSAYRQGLTPTWYRRMGIRLVRSDIQAQQVQRTNAIAYPDYSLINAQRKESYFRFYIGNFSSEESSLVIRRLENAGVDKSAIYTHNERDIYIKENLHGTIQIMLYQAGFGVVRRF